MESEKMKMSDPSVPHTKLAAGSTEERKSEIPKGPALSVHVEGTTLHGLNHVCVADTSRVRRVVWLLLLLGMFTCYLIVATYSFVKYYK